MIETNDDTPVGRVGLLLFVFLLSIHFGQIRPLFTTEADLSSVAQMSTWTAGLPAQYRVLTPLLVNGAQALAGLFGGQISFDAAGRAIDILGVLGCFMAFIGLMRCYTRDSFAIFLACVLLYYAVLVNYTLSPHYNHRCMYDMPALALFTTAIYALKSDRPWLYYGAFVLGVLNRETMIFATVAFLSVRCGELPWRTWLAHGAAQIAFYVVAKLALHWLFRDQLAIGLIEDAAQGRLMVAALGNLGHILSRDGALVLLTAFGGLWLPALVFAARTPDRFLRRLLPVVPLFLAVILIGGNVTEVRVYIELVPIVALLMGWKITTRLTPGDGWKGREWPPGPSDEASEGGPAQA